MKKIIKSACVSGLMCCVILFSCSAVFGAELPEENTLAAASQREYVIPGGTVFGIRLYTDGVIVAKTDSVTTDTGKRAPSRDAGLTAGDVITKISGKKVTKGSDVSDAVENSGGKPLTLSITRGESDFTLTLTPVRSAADGKYKAGLWVRDSSAGIGTVTFIEKESGIFGALGHAVCDIDSGELLPLAGGDAVNAKIKGCYRGSAGTPGELCGVLGGTIIGTLELNTPDGLFGVMNEVSRTEKAIPVALTGEVKTGKAQIISTVGEGGADYYDIEITKVRHTGEDGERNMIIKITDERLESITGGIVQGMSGSPIIQNGMLVGAVTHVFVNDPLRGYAVFAETMLRSADSLRGNEEKAAA